MARTIIVGRVSIKVWPDTSGFKQALKTQTKKASEGVKVQVEAEVDGTSLKQSTAIAVKEVNAMAKGDPRMQVRLRAQVDSVALSNSLGTATRQIQEFSTQAKRELREAMDATGMKIDPDSASLSNLKREIERITSQPSGSGLKFKVNRKWIDDQLWRGKPLEARIKVPNNVKPIEIPVMPAMDINELNRARGAMRKSLQDVMGKIVTAVRLRPVMDESYRDWAKELATLQITPTLNPRALGDISRSMYSLGRIKLWLDESGIKGALGDRAPREYQAAIGLDVAKADLVELRNKIQSGLARMFVNIKTAIDKSALNRARIQVKTAIGNFPAKIKPALDNVATRWVKTELKRIFGALAVGVSPTSIAKTYAELKAGFRDVHVKVKAVLDTKSYAIVSGALARLTGFRLMKQVFNFDALKDLDKQLPKIALLAIGIGNASAAFLSLSSGILGVGRDLAAIIPGALALPGIFTGLVVSAAAFGMAMAEVNGRFPDFTAGMKSIQAASNSAFWGKATGTFRELTNSWIPRFRHGMTAVGAASGSAFASLLRNLQSVVTVRLDGWFQAAAAGLKNFVSAGGTSGLANIVRGFGDLGAIYLPQFMSWLGQITSQFGTFLTRAVASGDAMTWVDDAVVQLRNLWGVISGTFGVLSGLSHAASAAGSGMGGLAAGLGRMSDVVNSPAFQFGLIGVFEASNRAMQNLATVAGPGLGAMWASLSQSLTVLLPIIGAVGGSFLDLVGRFVATPAVMGGVTNAFLGIQSLLTTLSPAITALGEGFGGLATLVGTAFTSFGPLIAEAFTSAGNAATGLLGALNQVIPVLAGGFLAVFLAIKPAIATLMPIISELVVWVGTTLGGILQWLAPVLASVASVVVPAIAEALRNLQAALAPIIGALTAFLTENGPALQAFLAWLVTTIALAIPGIINGIAGVIRGVTDVILGIIKTFASIFKGDWQGVWEGAKQILSGAWTAIKGIVDIALNIGVLGLVRKGFTLVQGVFTSSGSTIKSLWSGLWQTIGNVLKSAWEGLGRTISGGVSGVLTTFRNLPGQILGALGNLGGLLVNSGRALLDGFAQGIRSNIDGAVGAATNALDAVRRLFPFSPAKEGPFSGKGWTLYSGMSISESLADGISRRSGLARQAALDMASETRTALSDASLLTPGVGRTYGTRADVATASDTFNVHFTVNADELTDVVDLVEWIKGQRQRARQMGGR